MPFDGFVLTVNLLGSLIAALVILPLIDIATMVRSPILRRLWRTLSFALLCVVAMMLVAAFSIPHGSGTTALAIAGSYLVGASFLMGVVLLTRRTTQEVLRLDVLAQASFTDALTGLANRRRFDQRLADEVGRARAGGTPLTLLVLDVDHFKRVNDVHGHGAGDGVLKQVAAVLAAETRPLYTACRIGGEEFAVIVPGLDEHLAAPMAERLRQAIGKTNFRIRGIGDITATVSLGLATLRPGDCPETLQRRADSALYNAKGRGRDQVCLAA